MSAARTAAPGPLRTAAPGGKFARGQPLLAEAPEQRHLEVGLQIADYALGRARVIDRSLEMLDRAARRGLETLSADA